MKRYIVFWVCISVCMILISCSESTIKVAVQGAPGTEIYSSDYQNIGVIDDSGVINIILPSDKYCQLLYSHRPTSDEYIPFALDYEYKNYSKRRLWKDIGNVIGGIGLIGLTVTTIMELCGAEAALPLAMSAGVTLGGLGIAGASRSNTAEINRKLDFKYLPVQTANTDIEFTYPKFDEYKKEQVGKNKSATSKSATSKRTSKGGSASSKKIKDNASRIVGKYVGKGILSQNKEIIENYNDITIVIERNSKDVVLVSILESNGDNFFDSDGKYSVKRLSNGKFELILVGDKSAKIYIDTKNNLVYNHPNVNIDNEKYTFAIEAEKRVK